MTEVTPDDLTLVPTIHVGFDLGNRELTAMIIALQRAGKLEIVEQVVATPGSYDELQILARLENARLPDMPKAPLSTLPYYRQFERKRRPR